jgi:hypothetical protein
MRMLWESRKRLCSRFQVQEKWCGGLCWLIWKLVLLYIKLSPCCKLPFVCLAFLLSTAVICVLSCFLLVGCSFSFRLVDVISLLQI